MTLGIAPNDVYQSGEWYNRAGRPLGDGSSAIAVVSSRPVGRAQVGDVITLVQPDGQVLTSPGIFINKGAGYVSLASATTFTLTSSELPTEGTLWPIVARGTAGDGTVLESSPIYTGLQVGPVAITFPQVTGNVIAKSAVTVTAATFSGFPAPTVMRTYLLNGEVVWRGASYTLPENSTDSVLVVWETATNSMGTVTVASAGVQVKAAPNVIADVPSLRQVTTRASYDNTILGSTRQADACTRVQAMDTITALGVTFIASYSYLELPLTGTVTYKVVYEYLGQLAVVTWGGGASTTGTTAGGTRINSDLTPLGFTIPKGAFFNRRVYMTGTNGICVARGNAVARTFDNSVDRFNFSNTASPAIDNTELSKAAYDALPVQQYSNANLYALKPAAEWGMSQQPAVALIGDSRMCGETQDIPNAPYYLMEHGERIVGAKYAFSNFGASNEKGSDWANSSNSPLRKSVVNDYFQIILNGYGTNDLGSVVSVAALQVIDTAIKSLPSSQGKQFWRLTIPPRLSGVPTDLFTSYAGQSFATGDNFRTGFNAVILANAEGFYDRVFDEASVYTDPGTGKIKIYANARTVTGGIDNLTGLVTLTVGTFTVADNGHNLQGKQGAGWLWPAEAGGGLTFQSGGIGIIEYVSPTTCYLTNLVGTRIKPSSSIAGISLYVGASEPSLDGVHFARWLNEVLESTLQIPA